MPLCGRLMAQVTINDIADREARALTDGQCLSLGRLEVQWLDTPHMPHAWECGLLFERATRTLLCSDLFTEGGARHPAVSEADIRSAMVYSATKMGLVLEGAGAVGVAALRAGVITSDPAGRETVVILTGRNVAPKLLSEVLHS